MKEFTVKPAPEHLIQALFNRFRPFKIKPEGDGIELGVEMDIIDFLLAMDLLSRIPVDNKIKSKQHKPFIIFVLFSDVRIMW